MAPSKSSKVWEHFDLKPATTATDDKPAEGAKVKCKLCSAILSYSNSTGSMNNHLKMKHKPTFQSMTSPETTATPPVRSVKEMFGPITSTKKIAVTKSLALMCAIDIRPINMIKGDGFRHFVHMLEPKYVIPSPATISNNVTALYDDAKEELVKAITSTNISITTDGWTSLKNDSYVTITAHYITDKWEIGDKVISTHKVTESHTGENLAKDLTTSLSGFGVTPKNVVAMVTDNASNMKSCGEKLEWDQLFCYAHTLNLSTNKGIAVASKLTASCRDIVSFFRRSPQANAQLAEKQIAYGYKKSRSLIQDVSTRWNSTFMMLERLSEDRWPVDMVLSMRKSKKQKVPMALTDDNWDDVEQLQNALRPIFNVTEMMSGQTYVSLPATLNLIYGLTSGYLMPSEEDKPLTAKVKASIRRDLLDRTDMSTPEFADTLECRALILDPRHKKLSILPLAVRDLAYEAMAKAMADESHEPGTDETASSSLNDDDDLQCLDDVQPPPPKKKKKRTKGEDIDISAFMAGAGVAPTEAAKDTRDELTIYREEPAIETNPLKWWKMNAERYPNLANMAKKYLAIPATSTPSERVFSIAGQVITSRRANLDPENVNKLVFLHKNVDRSILGPLAKIESDTEDSDE